jgi:hypothetical protein
MANDEDPVQENKPTGIVPPSTDVMTSALAY